jgi:hypothetical protein
VKTTKILALGAEPATIALLGLGMAGLEARARRDDGEGDGEDDG